MNTRRKHHCRYHAPALEHDRSQKGNAIIEFAFILPIFLLILFGIVNFSIALYDKTVLTMATREGARVGILYAADQDEDDKINLANATASEVCQNRLISFGDNLVPEIESTIDDDILTVRATGTYSGLFVFPDMSLSGQTSMKIE